MCKVNNKDNRTTLVLAGFNRNENENTNHPSEIWQGCVDPPPVMFQHSTKTVD